MSGYRPSPTFDSITVTLSAVFSGTLSGTAIANYLAIPPGIGATTPNVGAFTTLSATGVVNGAGFVNLLSPYALLASPVFSGTPTAPTLSATDTSQSLATTAFVQNRLANTTTLPTTGGTTTLTQAQFYTSILLVTGTLIANAIVIVPNTGMWVVENDTTGSYTLTIKTASGTGNVVAQGYANLLIADGVNVVLPQVPSSTGGTFSNSTIISSTINSTPVGASTPSTGAFTTLSASGTVSGGGFTALLSPYALLASPSFSGTPVAPTATVGTDTTQLATTAFVQTQIAAIPLVVNITGNAGTATRLQTAVNINSVSFNGSASITIYDATKEPAIAVGTSTQFWRGDKTWQALSVSYLSDAATVATLTGIQTLTNKTINGSSNNFSNIANTALVNASLTLGTTTLTLGSTTSTITGIAAAVNPSDVTILSQVQSLVASGMHTYADVAAVFTSNVNISAPGALTDGTYVVQTNDHILLITQTTGSQNGPWIYTGSSTSLARPGDYASGSTINTSLIYAVIGIGSSRQYWQYILNTTNVTVDTTATNWGIFAPAISAGSNISVSGGVVSLIPSVNLTGIPTAPTAAVNANTTQLATTGFVLGQASGLTPGMDGTATIGVSTLYARADHIHASDTTRLSFTTYSSTTAFDFNNPAAGLSTTWLTRIAQSSPSTLNGPSGGNADKGNLFGFEQLTAYYYSEMFVQQGDPAAVFIRGAVDGGGFASWGSWHQLAFLDNPAFTGIPTAPTAAMSDTSSTLATTAFVQTRLNTTTSLITSGGSTTLNAIQYSASLLLVSGTLSVNATLVMPTLGHWIVANRTTGAYTLTVKTNTGSGVLISQGYTDAIVADGTNVVYANNDLGYGAAIIGAAITNSTAVLTTLSVSGTVSGSGITALLAAPPTIGSTTPSSGAFTALSASGIVSGSGFITYLAAPPAVGGTSPNTGAFTTLSASGAVSGAGFTTYFSSPPGIGGTTPNVGTFTNLSVSGTLNGSGVATLVAPYALLVSPGFSGTPTAPTPSTSDTSQTLATTAFVQNRLMAATAISTTGGSTTLTSSQYTAEIIIVTGILTAAATLVMPTAGHWIITNRTTGAYTLTVKTNTGSGVLISQGYTDAIVADGTNVVYANNDLGYGAAIANATISNSSGAFTTLSASGVVTGSGFTALLGAPPAIGVTTPGSGSFTTLSVNTTLFGSGVIALLATPSAIGSTTPNTGAFTTLTVSSTVSGTAFSTYLSEPPAIGSTTANVGAFTSLSASGTLSGAAFSTYLASPPAIGGTSPNTGAFTTLAVSGAIGGAGFSSYLASPPVIGGTTANAATFTTLTTTGNTTLNGILTTNGPINATMGLTSGTNTGSADLMINGAAGNGRNIRFDTASIPRWQFYVDGTAESGSNAGSNMNLLSWNDTGSINTTIIYWSRATGLMSVRQGLSVINGVSVDALTVTTSIAGTGITTYLAAPAPIGSTTPNTGAFSTLSANSVVSGVGFSTYLASPPVIGGTTANAATFTTLTASGTVSGSGFTTLLNPYALINSPTLTGLPAAPTAAVNTNTTQISTTAFVQTQIAAIPAVVNITGNAGTATRLQTAVNINSVSFNGSASITIYDATKEPAIAVGTSTQFWRGDKTWQALSVSYLSDAATLATLTGIQTLTNKTINGSSNTLSSIPNTALVNSALTIGSTVVSLGGTVATLTGLSAAVNPTDVTILSQVQSLVASGMHTYAEVAAVFSTNITVTTPGALTDGTYVVQTNDRILLIFQTTGSQNGPWVYNGSTSALTRPTDYASGSTISTSLIYTVIGIGSSKQYWQYILNTTNVTVDTTATTWGVFSSALSGGSNISISGGVVSLIGSPAFSGVPIAPTAAVNTNTTQLATTGFVLGQASSLTPVMDGTAAIGVSALYARADHVHASDTTLLPFIVYSSATTFDFNNPPLTTNSTWLTRIAQSSLSTINGPSGGTTDVGVLFGFEQVNAHQYSELFVQRGDPAEIFVRGANDGGGFLSWGSWHQLAFLDNPAFIGIPTAPTASISDSSTTLATTSFVQSRLASVSAIAITGGSTTLTAAQYYASILMVSGTLTANATLVVPNNGIWCVSNHTTGAFSLTVKTATGSGVTITQNYTDTIIAGGTNVNYADNDLSYGATIVGATIDATPIGATTPSAATFTALAATGNTILTTLTSHAIFAIGQNEFAFNSFADPQPGTPRDAKFGEFGIAVIGGVYTDTLTTTGATTLASLTLQNRTIYPNSYILAENSGTVQWVKIGTFTASQIGDKIHLRIIAASGYNAAIGPDSEIAITFKTSNGISLDSNGFAGDSYWYRLGQGQGAVQTVKWVANVAGASATSFTLYLYLGASTGTSSFYMVQTGTGTWIDAQVASQSDPGVGSGTVCVATEQFYVTSPNVLANGTTIAGALTLSGSVGGSPVSWSTSVQDTVYGHRFFSSNPLLSNVPVTLTTTASTATGTSILTVAPTTALANGMTVMGNNISSDTIIVILTTPVAITSAAAACTTTTLTVVSASNIVLGMVVSDTTTPSVIPANTTVIGISGTTLTLSASPTGAGIVSGDGLSFSCTQITINTTTSNTGVQIGSSLSFFSKVEQARFVQQSGNISSLRIYDYTATSAAGWGGYSKRMQMRIDNTDMGFIEYNTTNGSPVTLGYGNIFNPTYIMRSTTSGQAIFGNNVNIPVMIQGTAGDVNQGAQLQFINTSATASVQSKYLRVDSVGEFQVLNGTYAEILNLTDSGALSLNGPSAELSFPSVTGNKILLWGGSYGIAINNNDFALFSGDQFSFRNGSAGGTILASLSTAGVFTAASTVIGSSGGSNAIVAGITAIDSANMTIGLFPSLPGGAFNPIVVTGDALIVRGGAINSTALVLAPWSNTRSGLRLLGDGHVYSANNTLDDGSGNVTIAGTLAITGAATGATPSSTDNSTRLATTAFVQTITAALVTAMGSTTTLGSSDLILVSQGGVQKNITFGNLVTALATLLSTTLPASAGLMWNDNGAVSISQSSP